MAREALRSFEDKLLFVLHIIYPLSWYLKCFLKWATITSWDIFRKAIVIIRILYLAIFDPKFVTLNEKFVIQHSNIFNNLYIRYKM